MFLHFRATSPCHRHSILASQALEGFHRLWTLYPGYFGLLLLFHLPRALRFWVGIFTHRHFLPYAPFPTFLTQHTFINVSLGAGRSSFKFAGLHADPRNTDPAYLFVWFTVIDNLDSQKNSFLNRANYYHELLVVKSIHTLLKNLHNLWMVMKTSLMDG